MGKENARSQKSQITCLQDARNYMAFIRFLLCQVKETSEYINMVLPLWA
jgi:hypothetical protein